MLSSYHHANSRVTKQRDCRGENNTKYIIQVGQHEYQLRPIPSHPSRAWVCRKMNLIKSHRQQQLAVILVFYTARYCSRLYQVPGTKHVTATNTTKIVPGIPGTGISYIWREKKSTRLGPFSASCYILFIVYRYSKKEQYLVLVLDYKCTTSRRL